MIYCSRCGGKLVQYLDAEERTRHRCTGCEWIVYHNPVPIVLVLAVDSMGNVVYTRNQEWPQGMWGLVAGYIEQGETAEEAAIRELYEETGFTSDNPKFCGTKWYKNQLLICFHLDITGGRLRKGADVEAVELAKPEPERIPHGAQARALLEAYLA